MSSQIEAVSSDPVPSSPPGRYSFALAKAAQKTFLGGVLLTEFPQCGLECSHPALPEREIIQVNQQIDRLVVFVGLPLLDVRYNPIRCLECFDIFGSSSVLETLKAAHSN